MVQPLKQAHPSQTEEAQEQHQQQLESLAYQCYQAFFNKSPNRYRLLDQVKRYGVVEEDELTDKTIYLSEKAKKILRVVLKMIFRNGKAVVKQKYLNAITKCCEKQNKRLLNELLDLIQYKKIKVWEGKNFTYYFCITLSASLQEEIRDVEIRNKEIGRTKMSNPIYTNRDSSKEEYRSSNDLNFSKNSNINSNDNSQNHELLGKDSKVSKKEKKQVAPKSSNGFLGGKSLSEMQEYLTPDMCSELRSLSNRDFADNAIKEITAKIARHPKTMVNVRFMHINGFKKYMKEALEKELRDAVKCSNDNFYIKGNKTEEEMKQRATLAEREKYMKKEEDAAIFNRSDYTQFRARIAGGFPINLGYDILTNMIDVKKRGDVLTITMNKSVGLTEHYAQCLLGLAKGVGDYIGVRELEVIAWS